MNAAVRNATYEDLLQVPDNLIAEIVDGELITSPRPASAHAPQPGQYTKIPGLLHAVLVAVEVQVDGGFSLSRNCTLGPISLYLTLPGGDESGCQLFATFPILNWLRIGYVKSFPHEPLVLIGYGRSLSTLVKALVIYGWLILLPAP